MDPGKVSLRSNSSGILQQEVRMQLVYFSHGMPLGKPGSFRFENECYFERLAGRIGGQSEFDGEV